MRPVNQEISRLKRKVGDVMADVEVIEISRLRNLFSGSTGSQLNWVLRCLNMSIKTVLRYRGIRISFVCLPEKTGFDVADYAGQVEDRKSEIDQIYGKRKELLQARRLKAKHTPLVVNLKHKTCRRWRISKKEFMDKVSAAREAEARRVYPVSEYE